jgi:hypothetical protein
MKKLLSVVGIISSCLLLTSCIKMDVNLVINKDATVSGSMIFAVADSLAELGAGGANANSSESNPLEDSINTKAKGVTESVYKSNGYTGTKYTFDRIPFEEFNKGNSGGENEFKLIKDGNRLTVKGLIDFSQTDSGDSSSDLGALGDEFAKSITSSFDINIAVKFPVKVLKSTGKISDDGMTVSWKPKYGEKVDISTTVEIPSGFQFFYLIVILGLLGVGAAIYLILRRGRNSDTKEVIN